MVQNVNRFPATTAFAVFCRPEDLPCPPLPSIRESPQIRIFSYFARGISLFSSDGWDFFHECAHTVHLYRHSPLRSRCPLFIGIRLLILPSYVYEDYRNAGLSWIDFSSSPYAPCLSLAGMCLIGLASFNFLVVTCLHLKTLRLNFFDHAPFIHESFPHFPSRAVHCLDGLWDCAFLGSDVRFPRPFVSNPLAWADRIAVPGVFDSCPGICEEAADALPLGRSIALEEADAGHRLYFGGLGLWASGICWMGIDCGTCPTPYAPWRVEIPSASALPREVILLIDNRDLILTGSRFSTRFSTFLATGAFTVPSSGTSCLRSPFAGQWCAPSILAARWRLMWSWRLKRRCPIPWICISPSMREMPPRLPALLWKTGACAFALKCRTRGSGHPIHLICTR